MSFQSEATLLKEIREFLDKNRGASLKALADKAQEVKANSPALPFVNVQPYRYRPKGIQIDHGSTYLLPPHLRGNLVCGSSTGNGSCLYNSISILFTGKESHALLLRLLTVLELLENAEYYLRQHQFCSDYAWSDAAMLNYNAQDPEIRLYPKKPYLISEVHLMTHPTAWSPLLALYGVSSIIHRPLQSLYFQTVLRSVAERYSCLIQPREPLYYDPVPVVLWTSTRVTNKRGATKFSKNKNARPNHFVPCFLRNPDVFEEDYSETELSEDEDECVATEQITIVLSDDESTQVYFNCFY